MTVDRLCVPAALVVVLSLAVFPVAAQQAAPPAGQATEEEEAGTRGLKGSRTKIQPPKGATPAKGDTSKSGDVGASKGKPSAGAGTLVGAPATDPGSSRTKPPDAGQAGTDTKTIMPVPPLQPVTTQPQGPIVSYPPPTTVYPPAAPPTVGAPTARPAPQSQQAAPGDVTCVPATGGQVSCIVDRDHDGQPDPGTYASTEMPGATYTRIGDFIVVDIEGDGIVDEIVRADGVIEDVPVAGTNRTVDVVVIGPAPANAPPITSIDLDGDGVPDIVAGNIVGGGASGVYDTNNDGVPDVVYVPVTPGGNRIRVVDLPTNGVGPKPQPPVAGARPPGAGAAFGVVVVPAPVCEEPGLEVLARLECLQRAFKAGRFGEAEYEARKTKALTLIDAPHMGAEQALRALNEALRLSLISQNNYYTKVNQVISRL